MKLPWKNVGWSSPCTITWKLVPAQTTRHIVPYMNLTQQHETCIFLGQMEEEAWPDLQPNPSVSS